MEGFKISFCTVCMNRLHHLKLSLLKNIRDNEDYPDVEFVLLDYNSTDGLEEYIMNTLQKYIKTGRLKYYKTLSPKYFNRSHSRNLAFKLATGEILCNVDADNYTGKGFAAYLANAFLENGATFLSPAKRGATAPGDVFGRICVARRHFYMVGGYDERMVNYGFEDFDLINRLELSGLTCSAIDGSFLKALSHIEKERLANEAFTGDLSRIFINYLTPDASELLFLFKNNTYVHGTLINNTLFKHNDNISDLTKVQLQYEYAILEDAWVEGIWQNSDENLVLKNEAQIRSLCFDSQKTYYKTLPMDSSSSGFYQFTDPVMIENAVMFLSQITNRIIMESNKLEKKWVVNTNGFGKDIVFKNFDYHHPIAI